MTENAVVQEETKHNEELFRVYLSNAQTYFAHGKYEQALKEIQRAGNIDPMNKKLAFLAMELFKTVKNGKGLIKICESMLEIDSELTEVIINKAFGHYLMSNYDLAISIIRQVLSKQISEDQKNAAMELLGDCHYKQKDFDSAVNIYLILLEKSSNPVKIYIKLSGCYYHLSDAKNLGVTTGKLIELGITDEPILKLHDQALAQTKSLLNEKHKPRNLWERLFRNSYDPIAAEYLKLQIEKEHSDRRADEERRERLTDPLTRINNRQFFNEILMPYFDKDIPFCFVMMDFDKFKDVNDTFGHEGGDVVLMEFTKMGKKFFTQQINGRDLQTFCRFGGEEFAAIYFGTKEETIKKCEEFRQFIEDMLHMAANKQLKKEIWKLTVSIGLSEYPAEAKNYQEASALADKRAYMAKAAGRNKVISEGGESVLTESRANQLTEGQA